MQILHLDSSISGDASASRNLTTDIVKELSCDRPDAKVVYRDLVKDAIPHLTGPIAAGFRKVQVNSFDADTLAEQARSKTLVEELLASDIIVFGVPMYNFSVPSQLKAWLDRVVQPGRTFQYLESGPVGLTTGKRAIVASSRGGAYSIGPANVMDFQEAYLKAILGFIGITDVSFVRAELLSKGADTRIKSLEAAHASIKTVVR